MNKIKILPAQKTNKNLKKNNNNRKSKSKSKGKGKSKGKSKSRSKGKSRSKSKKQSGGVFLQLQDIHHRYKNVNLLKNEMYNKLPVEYQNIGNNTGTCVDFTQFFNRQF